MVLTAPAKSAGFEEISANIPCGYGGRHCRENCLSVASYNPGWAATYVAPQVLVLSTKTIELRGVA